MTQNNDRAYHENQGEELLQELGKRDCESNLDLIDVADNRGDQCSRGVTGKKCNGTLQDPVIEPVAQVSNQTQTSMVHQIRSCVVANTLDQGCAHQRHSNHRQRIAKILGYKILEVNGLLGPRNSKERKCTTRGRRVENA